MTIDEAREHVGEAVTYRAGGELAEDGVITSVGTRVAYVRYEGDRYPKATDPADLTLITPEDDEDDPEDASLRLEAAEERAFNAQLGDYPDDDCGCGLGAGRCAAAEDGDLGG